MSAMTSLERIEDHLFKRLGVHGLRSPLYVSKPVRFRACTIRAWSGPEPGPNTFRISQPGRISSLRTQLYGQLSRLQTQVGDFQPIEGRCERGKNLMLPDRVCLTPSPSLGQ